MEGGTVPERLLSEANLRWVSIRRCDEKKRSVQNTHKERDGLQILEVGQISNG